MGGRKPNSPETKQKKSESAKRRWDTMSPEYEIRFRKKKSAGMRKHWKKFTREERKRIGMKAAATKFRKKLELLGYGEEEIQAMVKEKYNVGDD